MVRKNDLSSEIELVRKNIKDFKGGADENDIRYKQWLDAFSELLGVSNIYEAEALKKAFPNLWFEFSLEWK